VPDDSAPSVVLPEAAQPRPTRILASLASLLGYLRGEPFAAVGAAIYTVIVVVAIFAPQIARYDPHHLLMANHRLAKSLPISAAHWLGTTSDSRDIFSELVYGTRAALEVGLTAAFAVVAIGTLLGLLAGYLGGWTDKVIIRLCDIVLGLPFLPSLLVTTALTAPGTLTIIIVVGALLWPNTARVIRAQVLSLRERAWVDAARVTGCSNARIMFVHVLPQVMPLAALYGSVAIGWAILAEAAASFLGFGDPNTISWGVMLQNAYSNQALSLGQWNWFVPPGTAILLMVLAGFLIARGSEKLLFPKLAEQ
jgi:peptide/nickel transport system permease protein